jgi:mannose-P-dolichol utilization defect protein 1
MFVVKILGGLTSGRRLQASADTRLSALPRHPYFHPFYRKSRRQIISTIRHNFNSTAKLQNYTMDSIRSALQPITQSLPAPIKDLGTSILGDQCYKSLVLDINVEDSECIKLAISKGLGIGIIAASSIVKVPQILKLINSKSASGVSFLSYLLETSAYLISLAYNVRQGFPVSTYGETGLILVQNVVIAVLVLNYSGRASAAAVFVAGLAASAGTLFAGNILDMSTLSYLQAGAGVLGVASKLPQILAVWQEGGTGQLSAFAVSGLN